MIINRQLTDKVLSFKECVDDIKNKNQNWKTKKEDIKSMLETTIKKVVEELLDDFMYNIEMEDEQIKIEIKNDYIKGNIYYKKLFNGKISVDFTCPDIKDKEGEIKEVKINIYNNPESINQIKIINDGCIINVVKKKL